MVLDYYRDLDKDLTFMELSEKFAILLLLATGKRQSEIRQLCFDNLEKYQNSYVFTLPGITKTSRWNKLEDICVEIEWLRSRDIRDKKVCPLRTLRTYIQESKKIRKSQRVFITTTTGTPVAGATLVHWTKSAIDFVPSSSSTYA